MRSNCRRSPTRSDIDLEPACTRAGTRSIPVAPTGDSLSTAGTKSTRTAVLIVVVRSVCHMRSTSDGAKHSAPVAVGIRLQLRARGTTMTSWRTVWLTSTSRLRRRRPHRGSARRGHARDTGERRDPRQRARPRPTAGLTFQAPRAEMRGAPSNLAPRASGGSSPYDRERSPEGDKPNVAPIGVHCQVARGFCSTTACKRSSGQHHVEIPPERCPVPDSRRPGPLAPTALQPRVLAGAPTSAAIRLTAERAVWC